MNNSVKKVYIKFCNINGKKEIKLAYEYGSCYMDFYSNGKYESCIFTDGAHRFLNDLLIGVA